MNTPSHWLMTAALRKALPEQKIPKWAVWLGSVAPDIPLYVLSFGGFWYFHRHLGWPMRDAGRHIYSTLYFHDPWWIGLHNALHSPTSLLLGLTACRLASTTWPRMSRWLKWFLLACLLHSLVDVVTHHDDGPLLFWPVEWTVRFNSPVSYWDHRHFGSRFVVCEILLDLLLAGYLLRHWWIDCRRSKQTFPSPP